LDRGVLMQPPTSPCPNTSSVSAHPTALHAYGGVTNQVIRIWLRYRNLENPKKPIVQTIYRLWAENLGGIPSPQFGLLDAKYQEQVEKYFNENVPAPQ
jgi:hypothetical protein